MSQNVGPTTLFQPRLPNVPRGWAGESVDVEVGLIRAAQSGIRVGENLVRPLVLNAAQLAVNPGSVLDGDRHSGR